MSAPAAAETPTAPEKPEKKHLFGRKAHEPKQPKQPKAPKPPKVRRSRGPAPWLMLAALLTAAGALAVLYFPIPGLTTPSEPAGGTNKADSQLGDVLQQREDALTKREEDLVTREKAVQDKEAQVRAALQDVTNSHKDGDALKEVVALYDAMSPIKAAPLLATLPTETAVKILRQIDPGQAAAILSYMEAGPASQIVQELAKPPAATNPAGG